VRILFDECAPWPLSKLLKGHTCSNPVKEGWRGIQNGELLKLAEAKFELFLTCDQGIRYQQNLKGRKIAILQLTTNDIGVLEKRSSEVLTAIASIQAGQYLELTLEEA
jgi:predicted nuclease of predicted toxin-antitoxin system